MNSVNQEAQLMVKKLLEALDDSPAPGVVHSERKRALRSRKHPLGNLPSWPESGDSHFEEVMGSKQFAQLVQKIEKYTGKKLSRQTLPGLSMSLFQSIGELSEIESDHRKELEDLAVKLVLMLPEFKPLASAIKNKDIILKPKITAEIDLSKAALSPDTPEEQEQLAKDLAGLDLEVQKRRLINAMIQGSAISKNYVFELVRSELSAISPRLINLYGTVMALSELGYWVMPDAMVRSAAAQGGASSGGSMHLEQQSDGSIIVHAQGRTFPIVVEELVKGLMEVISYTGLPQDPATRKKILKTDFIDHETWDMLIGPQLWKHFQDLLDLSEQELTTNLYSKIVQMPAPEFHAMMKKLYAGGAEAKAEIKKLINEIKVDLEHEDRADYEHEQTSKEENEAPVEDGDDDSDIDLSGFDFSGEEPKYESKARQIRSLAYSLIQEKFGGDLLLMETALWSKAKNKEFIQSVSSYKIKDDDTGAVRNLSTKKIEEVMNWALTNIQTYEGCSWFARSFRRSILFIADPELNPSVEKKQREIATQYSLATIYKTDGLIRGRSGQFRQSFEDLAEKAKSSARARRLLEGLTYVDDSGIDKPADEVYDQIHGALEALVQVGMLPGGEDLVVFPDRSRWVLRDTHGCKIEGGLMRHCGNTGGTAGDNLLSYREPMPGESDEENLFQPKLTFILDKRGFLGEMKGYANSKPKKEYHPKIIALLKNPKVKGIKGGGYKPEANFSLKDLSESDFNDLKSARPDLVNYQTKLKDLEYADLKVELD